MEVYDPLVAKIEAVLEHRRALVATRTLMLHQVGDQITKLPTEIRDQLTTNGKIEGRLRRLDTISRRRQTRREARRAHKRHLANRVIHRMWRDEKPNLSTNPTAT